MKEINIFIRPHDLSKVVDIIQRHGIGVTFLIYKDQGERPDQLLK